MNKDSFWELVVEDVKERVTPEEAQDLRKPENIENWRENLLQFKKDLERQAASRKSNFFEAKADARDDYHKVAILSAEYFRWKNSVCPILKSLESKLREAKLLRQKLLKQKETYTQGLWRLLNMAEILIPKDSLWHEELEQFRTRYKKKENKNV